MTLKEILNEISIKTKELQVLIDLYNKEMDIMKDSPIVKMVEKIFDKAAEINVVEIKKKESENENNKS